MARIRKPPRLTLLLVAGMLSGTAILALAGLARVLPTLLRVPSQLDFAAYYVAARLLNAQVGLYRPGGVDDAALGIAGIQHTGYIYPPFFAVLLRPLALLPYRQAEAIWFVCNLLLLAAVCVLLVRIVKLPWLWGLLLLPLSLLLPAVYDTWLLGQVSVLLTALLLASLLLANITPSQPRHDLAAGLLLGFAAAIKIYPIVLAGVYLRHRRWWALVGVASSLLLALAVGVLFGGGWETTYYWLTAVLPAASAMAPFPSNQSLRGVLERFFTFNTFRVPVLSADNYVNVVLTPLFESPALAAIGVLLGSAGIIIITAGVLLRRPLPNRPYALTLDFAIGTTAMLLVTPVVWDLYYVHLLLPLVLLVTIYRGLPGVWIAFALACLLLALQRYWRYILLYMQSPWLMICGFLAVGLLWAALLSIRAQGDEDDSANQAVVAPASSCA